jgi:hypothetical protein
MGSTYLREQAGRSMKENKWKENGNWNTRGHRSTNTPPFLSLGAIVTMPKATQRPVGHMPRDANALYC